MVPAMTTEYTFTNLFMWGQGEGIRVAEYNGALFIAASWENSPFMFAPLTENAEGDYAAALARCSGVFPENWARSPSFRAICGPIKAAFERCSLGLFWRRTGTVRVYVYSMESLLTLSGKSCMANATTLISSARNMGTWPSMWKLRRTCWANAWAFTASGSPGRMPQSPVC